MAVRPREKKLMLKVRVKSHPSWWSHGSRGRRSTFVGTNQVPGAARNSRNSQIKPCSYPCGAHKLTEKTE